jgi:CD68 antigen
LHTCTLAHFGGASTLSPCLKQQHDYTTPNHTQPQPQTTNHKPQTTNHKPQTTKQKPQTTNQKPKTTHHTHKPQTTTCSASDDFVHCVIKPYVIGLCAIVRDQTMRDQTIVITKPLSTKKRVLTEHRRCLR